MDYEQKYKDALETAKSFYRENKNFNANFLHNIFPELKESEEEKNEKIRIGLIKAFNTVGAWRWGGLSVPDVLAWLEKQDNKLDADKVIEWIEEHVPTKFEDMQNYVAQFRKDFGL